MAKVFRQSTRESNIISKIESQKEHARRNTIGSIRDCIEPFSKAIAMKLVENNLVETTNKTSLEDQLRRCLEALIYAEDFDIDYQVAPFRNVAANPNIVTLFLTAFVIEKLINHKDVVDIFGSDEDIYKCIDVQVAKFLPA